MTVFNDRRDTVTPEAVSSRLTSDKVVLKPRGEGEHAVLHRGQEVGTVFTYPPTDDPGVGRFAIAGSGEIGFHNRSTAARFAVAAHDVRTNKIGGFTQAHHDFIHSNHPVKARRARR